jgi:hypothetical protein
MLSPALRAPSFAPHRAWGRSLETLSLSAIARTSAAPLPDRGVRFVMAVLAGIILSASAGHTALVGLDRTTPAWLRVTSEIRAQGLGNCYHAALTLATEARALGLENVSVIQGTLMGQGPLEGVRFGHSWLEANIPGQTTRVVLDYSSGNSLVMDRDAYRFLHRARDVHEYSVSEARSLASNGSYGPWTADLLSAWHP